MAEEDDGAGATAGGGRRCRFWPTVVVAAAAATTFWAAREDALSAAKAISRAALLALAEAAAASVAFPTTAAAALAFPAAMVTELASRAAAAPGSIRAEQLGFVSERERNGENGFHLMSTVTTINGGVGRLGFRNANVGRKEEEGVHFSESDVGAAIIQKRNVVDAKI